MTEESAGHPPPVPATASQPPSAPPLPAAVTQEPPQQKKRRGRGPAKKAAAILGGSVRVRPVHPYTINIFTQGIVIPPGRDASVELDDFVNSQIAAGVLELSQ